METKPVCGIHQKTMKLGKFGYFCPTPVKKDASGAVLSWCDFKVKDLLNNPDSEPQVSKPQTTPVNETTSSNNTEDATDWGKIARGKVRSLLVQAIIQHRGLEIITEADIDALEGWVDYCMSGKKLEDIEF